MAKKILPFYLTGTPTTVEYNRAEEDGKIRIRGETFVFSKHQSTKNQDLSKNRYFDSRGFTNPIKAKAEKIIIPVFVKIDSKQ